MGCSRGAEQHHVVRWQPGASCGPGIRAQQVARLNGIPPRSQAGQLFRLSASLAVAKSQCAPVDTQDRLALGKPQSWSDAQQCYIPANGDNLFCLDNACCWGRNTALVSTCSPASSSASRGMDAVFDPTNDHLTGNGKISIFDSVWKKKNGQALFPFPGMVSKATPAQFRLTAA